MAGSTRRTSVTINQPLADKLKKAAVEATIRSQTLIRPTDLVHYLLNNHLNDAVQGIVSANKHPS